MSACLFETGATDRRRAAELDRLRNRSHYVQRLAAVLGRGMDWEYRGECLDLQWPSGRCTCGHTGLRYLFTIHHKTSGRTAIVGSTCVTTYPGISPELAERLTAEVERLEDIARRKAAAARDAALKGPARLFDAV